VVRRGEIELRVAAIPLLAVHGDGADGADGAADGRRKVPGMADSAAEKRPESGSENGRKRAKTPGGASAARSEIYDGWGCSVAAVELRAEVTIDAPAHVRRRPPGHLRSRAPA
jgi:hypothetical protein